MAITQLKAKIISNERVKNNYWLLRLECAEIAGKACPGQFVEIRVREGVEPLLRRPISIHDAHKAGISLFYERVGIGTRMLSERARGNFLDVIGPLGNGFACNRLGKKDKVVLVAGGMGVAPLVFLAKRLKTIKPLVLIGARTRAQVVCSKEFKEAGCSVKIATDDGSAGFKGKVTGLLESCLGQGGFSQIFACGPSPMLKSVSRISRQNHIGSQLSLEEHMACGIGACLGCVVNTKNGYKRVCKEGPVFSGEELVW
jgi:dihydroorotate dehydrogenase electron transfer subunit